MKIFDWVRGRFCNKVAAGGPSENSVIGNDNVHLEGETDSSVMGGHLLKNGIFRMETFRYEPLTNDDEDDGDDDNDDIQSKFNSSPWVFGGINGEFDYMVIEKSRTTLADLFLADMNWDLDEKEEVQPPINKVEVVKEKTFNSSKRRRAKKLPVAEDHSIWKLHRLMPRSWGRKIHPDIISSTACKILENKYEISIHSDALLHVPTHSNPGSDAIAKLSASHGARCM